LRKAAKKAPMVEYQIPKTIFATEDGGDGDFGVLLGEVLSTGKS
jgi:hypothetical protein